MSEPVNRGQDTSVGDDSSDTGDEIEPAVISLVGLRDQVFPSLEVVPATLALDPLAISGANITPVARNIFSFWPERSDESREADASEISDPREVPNHEALVELHDESRRRSRTRAEVFVRSHVRRLAKDYAVITPHDDFGIGTLLISQDMVPTSRRRHARFQWAVTNGRVVELKGARLPVGHLEVPALTSDLLAEVHVGGEEVATFLAYLLDLFRVDPTHPIAALGTLAIHTNELLFAPDLDAFIDAAREGGMHDVIFSRHDDVGAGIHDGLCFWPVLDANEAAFAVLSAVSGDIVNPHLRRRALTKEAYAWASVALVLLGIGIYQLAVAVGKIPPLSFSWFVLVLVLLFFAGTRLCTHRFWRLDR